MFWGWVKYDLLSPLPPLLPVYVCAQIFRRNGNVKLSNVDAMALVKSEDSLFTLQGCSQRLPTPFLLALPVGEEHAIIPDAINHRSREHVQMYVRST